MRAYIDSDVLIWHLRGEPKALEFLHRLRRDEQLELWTGAMQRAEVIFFMRPAEKDSTLLFMSQFSTAAANEEIIDKAATLYREWHGSHGMDINDAILAATALTTGGRIYSLNKKHYPMPELSVSRAW